MIVVDVGSDLVAQRRVENVSIVEVDVCLQTAALVAYQGVAGMEELI